MQYFLSIITGLSIWAMGNKTILGPIIGLITQVFWVIYVIMTSQWGLLPGVILLSAINLRNLIKWLKEDKSLAYN
jgi:hypothetical protein